MVFLEKEGFKILLNDNNEIKVENFSKTMCRIKFVNINDKFNGYVNLNFSPGHWVMSNPKTWKQSPTNNPRIEITGPNFRYFIDIDIDKKSIFELIKPNIKIKNYDVEVLNVSFLLPAYGTKKYIDECISSIENACNEHINYEIIVGVDYDYDLFGHLIEHEYSDKLKFYFFNESLGPFYVRNTLSKIAKHENLIFFDSDDICSYDLLNTIREYIDEYEIIRWNPLSFIDGDDYISNHKKLDGFLGGCFFIKKEKFIRVNGFHPWRCQSDDEFKKRVDVKSKIKFINEGLFYYRKRNNSLSNSVETNKQSKMRQVYVNYLSDNIPKGLKNPNRLYISDDYFRLK